MSKQPKIDIGTVIEQQLVAVASSIEDLVERHGIDYIDACLKYCQDNDLEYDYIGEVIVRNPALRSKLQAEAEDLHFLKKRARIPL